MTYIAFDVGANWGQDSLEATRNDPTRITYAFEPTPELQQHLRRESFFFFERYIVEGFAVSDFDGRADFNIASHQDWGTSSLLTFSPGLDKTWAGRHDFYVDRTEEVEVRRLDGWLAEHPEITHIDYFHCDTQGSDLKVLKGMGEYVGLIREGVIEVPDSTEVALYQGQHTREDAVAFLEDSGFDIIGVTQQQNEQNLHFRRKA